MDTFFKRFLQEGLLEKNMFRFRVLIFRVVTNAVAIPFSRSVAAAILWILFLSPLVYGSDSQPRPTAEYIAKLKDAAEKGDPRAQFSLGHFYLLGNGVTQDFRQATNWLRKAAEQDNPGAEFELGYFYSGGKGASPDYREAAKWLRKAAEHNDDLAECSLGYLYANGLGVPLDYAEAVRWYRKSADQGVFQAQENLGLLYVQGRGVKSSKTDAFFWLSLAVAHGASDIKPTLDAISQSMTPEEMAKGRQRLLAWRPVPNNQ